MFISAVCTYIEGQFLEREHRQGQGIVMPALSLAIAIGFPAESFITSIAAWN